MQNQPVQSSDILEKNSFCTLVFFWSPRPGDGVAAWPCAELNPTQTSAVAFTQMIFQFFISSLVCSPVCQNPWFIVGHFHLIIHRYNKHNLPKAGPSPHISPPCLTPNLISSLIFSKLDSISKYLFGCKGLYTYLLGPGPLFSIHLAHFWFHHDSACLIPFLWGKAQTSHPSTQADVWKHSLPASIFPVSFSSQAVLTIHSA